MHMRLTCQHLEGGRVVHLGLQLLLAHALHAALNLRQRQQQCVKNACTYVSRRPVQQHGAWHAS
jgi:hypothetical protein